MTADKQNIGKLGEDIAVKYLKNHNYVILERNYRKPWGEIDIVAKQSHELVFIEVKAQSDSLWIEWRPEENITQHKKHQLSRIILTYLKEHKIPESQDWRADVLSIKLDFKTKNAQIEHIENVILN